jgi:hypothetical protein
MRIVFPSDAVIAKKAFFTSLTSKHRSVHGSTEEQQERILLNAACEANVTGFISK